MTPSVLASPLPDMPMLATTATSPLAAMSMALGRRPDAISRLVSSTLAPSTESTAMRWSPSRVTSARLPSGENTTCLGPEFGLPTVTLPAGVTVVPLIVNTETVPSAWLATRARVPALLMDTPEAPLPACSVATILGTGDAPWAPLRPPCGGG